jgi:outer membrane murein-binding lipoprotein Lpp
MSNDLTQRLNGSLEDKIDRLITAVQSMDSRLGSLEARVEQLLRDTQPIWKLCKPS